MAVVVVTWLIAGTLDAGIALLFFMVRSKQPPGMLFRYIASAVFGQKAFTSGAYMAVLGLCFHFLLALGWVGFYFSVFHRIFNHGLLIDALVYGSLVWLVMNLVIVPLSRAVPRPFSLSFVVINILILVLAIGLPCAYGAQHYS